MPQEPKKKRDQKKEGARSGRGHSPGARASTNGNQPDQRATKTKFENLGDYEDDDFVYLGWDEAVEAIEKKKRIKKPKPKPRKRQRSE